ncbi:chaplin family protein [Streptomyces sp. P17]|uniref:chaplin n=1 Tax=Streptomyces sp. P17 TaxID=3074716 RepID=UPI0028F42834|nr:chaplin family protein [Streptomyces sp. P17]MDT9701523.1 chaplin family protein [Streptomyces sp. P17]
MRQVTRKGLMTVAAATGVIAAAGGSAQADSGASGSSSSSPGVLSGNTVQAPVYAPVNACGNTVNVVGVLNPAVGNTCVTQGGGSDGGYGEPGGSGGAHSGGRASDSPGVASGNHVEVPVHAPVNVCGNSADIIGVGNGTTGNDCANGGGGHNPPGGGYGNPPGAPEQPGNPGGPQNPGNPGSPEEPGNSGNHPGNPNNPRDRDNPDGPPRSGTPGTPSTPGEVTPNGSPQADLPGARSVTQSEGLASLAATGSDLPLGLALPMGAGALLAGAVLYRKARASA